MPLDPITANAQRTIPGPHVNAVRARWARDEVRYGAGFTERHAECFAADLQSAQRCDANAEGNREAAAALKATGGDKQAALALLLSGQAPIQRAVAQAARVAA